MLPCLEGDGAVGGNHPLAHLGVVCVVDDVAKRVEDRHFGLPVLPRARELEREGEVLIFTGCGSPRDLLGDHEVAAGVIRIRDVVAVNGGDVGRCRGHVLLDGVFDLLTDRLVLVEVRERVRPIAVDVRAHGLAPDVLAVRIEVHLHGGGTHARGVTDPGLGAGDLHLLRLAPVGYGEGRVSVKADVRHVALNVVFDEGVDDLGAVVLVEGEIAEGALPAVLVAQGEARADIVPIVVGKRLLNGPAVGIEVHGHAVGALAVLVFCVVPHLGDGELVGNEAHLGVVLVDELVLAARARGGVDGVGLHVHVVVGVRVIGDEPLRILAARRAHVHDNRDGLLGIEDKVPTVRRLPGVDGDGRHGGEVDVLGEQLPDGVVELAILIQEILLVRIGAAVRVFRRELVQPQVLLDTVVDRRGAARSLEGAQVDPLEGAVPDVANPGVLDVTWVEVILGGREVLERVVEDDVGGLGICLACHGQAIAVPAAHVDVAILALQGHPLIVRPAVVPLDAARPAAVVVHHDALGELGLGALEHVETCRDAGVEGVGVIAIGIEVAHRVAFLIAYECVLGAYVIAPARIVLFTPVALDAAQLRVVGHVGDDVVDAQAVVLDGLVAVRCVKSYGDDVFVVADVALVSHRGHGSEIGRDHQERAPGPLVVLDGVHLAHGVPVAQPHGVEQRRHALGQQVKPRAPALRRKGPVRERLLVGRAVRDGGLDAHLGLVAQRDLAGVDVVFHPRRALLDVRTRLCRVAHEAVRAVLLKGDDGSGVFHLRIVVGRGDHGGGVVHLDHGVERLLEGLLREAAERAPMQ